MENSLKLAPNEATGSNPIEEEDLTDYVSSDPLNRVLDPVAGSHRPGSNAIKPSYFVVNAQAK
jgi:hypothetical protein